MNSWKIIIVIIIATLIVLLGVYKNTILEPLIGTKETIIDIDSDVPKKIKVKLTKEEFDRIKIPENIAIFYFPEDCPDYTSEIYIVSNILFERYFIPEKESLIIVEKDHKWTNDHKNIVMWQRL